MPLSQEEKLRRLVAQMKESIEASINSRWDLPEWDVMFPWWRKPAEVKILMYTDGPMRFTGGIFGGLQYVKTLLESRAYPYVDFDVTTAHREGADPTASIQSPIKLTDLNLMDFDEIWFFGFRGSDLLKLTQDELDRLDEFMTKRKDSETNKLGGVLITGDHSNLGEGLGGKINRAGKMRSWQIDGLGPNRHSTLEEGPEAHRRFEDIVQSDDRPQKIMLRLFRKPSSLGFGVELRPHPVLCGPDGPIDVLPDHQHEGATLEFESTFLDEEEWRIKDGHQEQPHIIAYGNPKDPEVFFRQFGLVSAYNGHTVDAGRIVADSSWHHWVDKNLIGTFQNLYQGFDATPTGELVLKKIDAYFLNCGVWLAPPQKQIEMRNATWWSILWTDRIIEIPSDAPLWYFGEQAIRALNELASSCTVTEWILDLPVFEDKARRDWLRLAERFEFFNLPFERFIAGGILKELIQQHGPSTEKLELPTEAPADKVLEFAINSGTTRGLSALKSKLERDASRLLSVLENDFRLNLTAEIER